jgi:hypothetical protein
MIGRNEADPVWEDHIACYIGCEVCQIAVRVWRPEARDRPLRIAVSTS